MRNSFYEMGHCWIPEKYHSKPRKQGQWHTTFVVPAIVELEWAAQASQDIRNSFTYKILWNGTCQISYEIAQQTQETRPRVQSVCSVSHCLNELHMQVQSSHFSWIFMSCIYSRVSFSAFQSCPQLITTQTMARTLHHWSCFLLHSWCLPCHFSGIRHVPVLYKSFLCHDLLVQLIYNGLHYERRVPVYLLPANRPQRYNTTCSCGTSV